MFITRHIFIVQNISSVQRLKEEWNNISKWISSERICSRSIGQWITFVDSYMIVLWEKQIYTN